MTRTGTPIEQYRVRNGKARLFPILRALTLLSAALLFTVGAARAQSGSASAGPAYPSISSNLSSVSRPGNSIYTRKSAAATSQKSAVSPLAALSSVEPDVDAETPGETAPPVSSASVPQSPLAAARAARTDQPKVVDDELLSELSLPASRPTLSTGAEAPSVERYSYFDDSDFTLPETPDASDSKDVPASAPSAPPRTVDVSDEISQVAPPAAPPREDAADAPRPAAENGYVGFADLETFDVPDVLPSEPTREFQSFAERHADGAPLSSSAAPEPESASVNMTPSEISQAAPPAAPPREDAADAPRPTAAGGYGEFADLETFDVPAELPAPTEGESPAAETASLPETAAAGGTAAATYDSGFTVSDGASGTESTSEPPKLAASPKRPEYAGFAEVETLDGPGSVAAPPGESEFPEFARNAYEALEPSEKELAGVIDREKGKPQRERKSIAEKEEAERELKAEYDAWLAKQRADQKEKDKLPRYLQPLDDDRAVFESEDSPYARGKTNPAAEEHKFVREISAADLTLMSEVSSSRELMDWEKEEDAPIDWSKYSASTLYNKWRDYVGMGPNEKEALAIMKKATLELMDWEKTKEPKTLRQAGELYEKAGKKWPESILEEDALFYAGECAFFGKNYTKAKTFYKALLSKYSNSVLRRDAMERLYWIGVYWVKCAEEDPEVIGRFEGKERPRFSDFAGAKDAFETIFTNDVSDRGRAPDAVFALANAYMRRGVKQGDASFEEAAKYYQRLYEFYPACKYADRAYQLAMLALYQSYRGPFYDSTPLRRAEEIAKAAQRARKGDRKVIEEQLRLIREKQAEYLLVRGEYYEKKKIYASARSYYQRLIDEFPDSEYAAKGAERYAAIRENPAESDQFALIRPIAPFLPDSKNQYFEDQPGMRVSAAVSGEGEKENDIANPDFTQLEKTAESGRTQNEVR